MTTTSPRRAPRGRRLLTVLALCGLAGALAAAPGADAAAKKAAKSSKTAAKKKPSAVPYQPNGRAPQAAAPFLWEVASTDQTLVASPSFEAATTSIVPNNQLFTLLIIGSDARPGENPEKSRSDSVHLLVWNPAWNKGILIGFPRDLYLTLPGTKTQKKLSEIMPAGGPNAVVSVIASVTKIPNTRYIVTGFDGFVSIINELGGVNVLVDPPMNDTASAAVFARGWFAMNGKAALAFNRARKTLANGDFGRSANQGKFLLYGLAKMREETSDNTGLVRYVNTFRKYGRTNVAVTDMLKIAQIARQVDPNNMQNVVVKGKAAKVKGADVVLLDTADAAGLFDDVKHDAVNNGR